MVRHRAYEYIGIHLNISKTLRRIPKEEERMKNKDGDKLNLLHNVVFP